MLDAERLKKFIEKLETDGIEKVRQDLALGIYGSTNDPRSKVPLIQNWLDKKNKEQEEANKKQVIMIARESNEIVRESNKIARSAKNSSWLALAISIISILIAILKK